MPAEVKCFWTEPNGQVRLWLRRYSNDRENVCANVRTYCNAHTDFGDHPARLSPEGWLQPFDDIAPTHDDPRWPSKCDACGRAFADTDAWQVFQEAMYQRTDTGAEFCLRDAPVGAMFDARWNDKKGPDGRSLCVVLPPTGGLVNVWEVDGPSNNGGGWTRSGDIPNVTALPSIQTPRYHGWLRGGVLVPV